MELEVTSKGSIEATAICKGNKHPVIFNGVLQVPILKVNLLFVSQMRKKGYTVRFTDEKHEKGICEVTNINNRKLSVMGI